jgi:dihydroxyacetone kinase-like predicted kinase
VVEDRDIKSSADGQDFVQLVRAGLIWLQHHQESVNALNVFPVPDGDTGTNMVLTMQSAWNEVAELSERHVGDVAHKVAHGALMGARGNSGVILSQIWRGMARKLEDQRVLHGANLAMAMVEGAHTAYRGVIRPVEGTILTVAREVADEATRAANESGELAYVLGHMVERARDAVARTPELLAVLAEAGVVDAGGQGLYIILEGMHRYLNGEAILENMVLAHTEHPAGAAHVVLEDAYGYDVQFIIIGDGLDVPAIHVLDPGVPLSYAAQLGSLQDVVVEDMQAQSQQFSAARGRPPALVEPPTDVEGVALVAVAAGDGLARVLQSLGVTSIVHGGQTMNPSTEEILRAVEELPNEQVIVLPNNKNIVMAAEQARDLSTKRVVVVPTRSIPQGISAVLTLNHQADLETNANMMLQAMQEVRTGEVTVATRDVGLGGLAVKAGQVIGLLDDELVVAGEAPRDVVQRLLERMDASELEIVTLYFGADVAPAEAQELGEQLQDLHAELEFEVLEGGQPHYFYIISAE